MSPPMRAFGGGAKTALQVHLNSGEKEKGCKLVRAHQLKSLPDGVDAKLIIITICVSNHNY